MMEPGEGGATSARGRELLGQYRQQSAATEAMQSARAMLQTVAGDLTTPARPAVFATAAFAPTPGTQNALNEASPLPERFAHNDDERLEQIERLLAKPGPANNATFLELYRERSEIYARQLKIARRQLEEEQQRGLELDNELHRGGPTANVELINHGKAVLGLARRLEPLKDRLRETTERAEEAERRVAVLEEDLARAHENHAEVQGLRLAVEDSARLLAESQGEVAALQRELEEARAQTDTLATLQTVREELDSANAYIQELEDSLDEAKAQADALGEAERRANALAASLQERDRDIDRLRSEMQRTEALVERLQRDAGDSASDRRRIEELERELDESVRIQRIENETFEQRLAAATRKITETREAGDAAREKALEALTVKYQEQLKSLEAERQADLGRVRAEAEALRREGEAQRRQIEEIGRDVEAARGVTEALEQRAQDAEDRCLTLESESNALRLEMEQAGRARDAAVQALGARTDEMQAETQRAMREAERANSLAVQLAEARAALETASKASELAGHFSQFSAKTDSLSKKLEEIPALSDQIFALSREKASMSERLTQSEEAVRRLNREVDQRDAELSGLRRDLDVKAAEIASLNAQRTAEAAAVAAQRERLNAQHETLRGQYQTLHERLQATQRAHEEALAAAAAETDRRVGLQAAKTAALEGQLEQVKQLNDTQQQQLDAIQFDLKRNERIRADLDDALASKRALEQQVGVLSRQFEDVDRERRTLLDQLQKTVAAAGIAGVPSLSAPLPPPQTAGNLPEQARFTRELLERIAQLEQANQGLAHEVGERDGRLQEYGRHVQELEARERQLEATLREQQFQGVNPNDPQVAYRLRTLEQMVLEPLATASSLQLDLRRSRASMAVYERHSSMLVHLLQLERVRYESLKYAYEYTEGQRRALFAALTHTPINAVRAALATALNAPLGIHVTTLEHLAWLRTVGVTSVAGTGSSVHYGGGNGSVLWPNSSYIGSTAAAATMIMMPVPVVSELTLVETALAGRIMPLAASGGRRGGALVWRMKVARAFARAFARFKLAGRRARLERDSASQQMEQLKINKAVAEAAGVKM